MRRGRTTRLILASVVFILLFSGSAEATQRIGTGLGTSQIGPSNQSYPSTSWALGVVVPEGALMSDGGKLQWEDVRNVTASFTLPKISMPDGTIYTVVSVMTDRGAVLQAAAGIRKNGSAWLAYSWSIPSIDAVPLVYRWVLNASYPEMRPGSSVTVSIFDASGQWNLSVRDASTGAAVVQAFPSGLGESLKAGDQEVFSFESYSRSSRTFSGMGNLTLRSLAMDGANVTGGTYSYSEWDPSRSPLFVVGSSGTSPPSFISFGQAADGSFVWGYEEVWKTGGYSVLPVVVTVAAVLFPILFAMGFILWKTRRPRNLIVSPENYAPS